MAKKEVDITKERVAAKMKSISKGYRKAIDSSKRSGGGRVVTMYYDSCRELWKGSPAVNNRCVALRKQSLNRKSNCTIKDKYNYSTCILQLDFTTLGKGMDYIFQR